ncbi:hypothetical protein [Pendulispora albinea]|uniref:Uncharacterized protein n=1 Tax=Pendulispora albinea TaxID=2741071 RepID=A0ABZ2LZ14_9BACT
MKNAPAMKHAEVTNGFMCGALPGLIVYAIHDRRLVIVVVDVVDETSA